MSEDPLITVIIPARNEAQHLPRCLQALRRAADRLGAPVEVIVVLNRCTDHTGEVALAHGCRIVKNDSKNLSQIRNAGAAQALGAYIVTIDADSEMSPNLLAAVAEELGKPKIVGGGVFVLAERWSLGIFLTGLFLLPLFIRSRFSAGLFYCRKKDFDAIGGFNENLVSVEDIDFAQRLRLYGKATGRSYKTLFRAYIRTSCRKFDLLGDWYFLRHPAFFRALIKGNQAAADKYWYDCER